MTNTHDVLTHKPVKVITDNGSDKVFCTEPYAQDLYDLMFSGTTRINSFAEVGATKKGTIISINREDIVLEVPSFKGDVYIPLRGKDAELSNQVSVGEELEFLVTNVTHRPYMVTGSVSAFENIHADEVISSLHTRKEPIKVLVNEMFAPGYAVTANIDGVSIQMFMPHIQSGINKLVEPENLVGQEIDVMVVEYSYDNRTFIVSRKRYLETLIPAAIKKLKQAVVYTGKVTGTTNYGVFVEFHECLTGMIHVANLHPDYKDSIATITPGTYVEFLVKEVLNNKIILTQIQRNSLWDTIKVGQKLSGTVKDIKAFGALVQLDEETLGLIHTSEVEKLSKSLNKGEQVNVRVLSANRTHRKIFLTVV